MLSGILFYVMVAMDLSRSHIFKLGQLLITKKPDVATELLQYIPPMESDLSKIPGFFKAFCKLQGISQAEYIGALYSHSKTDTRRLFVACMLAMYGPGKKYLQKHLTEAIGGHQSNTSSMITEVEFRYRKIADYKHEVDGIVSKLRGK